MKKSAICPKCESTDIYTNAGQAKRSERNILGVSSWKRLFAESYVCLTCGYIEEYVEKPDLEDTSKMDKVREVWKKHKS